MANYTKTPAEHAEFVIKQARLELWWMWGWLRTHPDDFEHCLEERVGFTRYTPFVHERFQLRKDAEWDAVCDELRCIWQRANSARDFEENGISFFRGMLEERAEIDYAEPPYREGYQCGSLKYDPPGNPAYPDALFIHIANDCRPKSIFDDPSYLPGCLACLLRKVEAEYGRRNLGTATWLNSHPRWLAQFPREWQKNLEPPLEEVSWAATFWGQFMNARGTFNDRLGERMRATGEFPFKPRYAWCTFDALERHVGVVTEGKDSAEFGV